MKFQEKLVALRNLYNTIDAEIDAFKEETGISCLTGCGKCCLNPNIEVSPLEFLLFADQAFKQGKIESYFDLLEKETPPLCIILSSFLTGGGFCSEYNVRGVMCRTFGLTLSKDKYNKPRMNTCLEIKNALPTEVAKVSETVFDPETAPFVIKYYTALQDIDYTLAQENMHINKAIYKALTIVWNHYTYGDPITENTLCS